MRDETRMLLESMGRLFEDHCTKAVADSAEAGTFPDALWQAVSDTGVPLARPSRGLRCRMVRPLRRAARRRPLRRADPAGRDHAGGVGGVGRGLDVERDSR